LDRAFKDTWNFVGFYDLKPEVHPRKLFIGEFVSALVFPCGEIEIGKGQCGQCAAEERVMIAQDVSKLENYIACDDDTQSEIVLPCFEIVEDEEEEDEEYGDMGGDAGGTGGASKKRGVRKLRTVLDIDSTNIGNFDEEDQRGLEKIISLIYPS
jgi:L-methionine (R)-S-oxide reductase